MCVCLTCLSVRHVVWMHGLFIASCEPSSWPVINNNDVCQIDLMNWRWCFRSQEPGTSSSLPPPGSIIRHAGQGWPPRCQAAWGPAAPLPGDRHSGTCAQIFSQKILHKNPCRPAAGRPGYIPVNFENKNIFLQKTKLKNKKIKKARLSPNSRMRKLLPKRVSVFPGGQRLRPCLEPNFFQKSLSHQKESYYFIVLNKICL